MENIHYEDKNTKHWKRANTLLLFSMVFRLYLSYDLVDDHAITEEKSPDCDNLNTGQIQIMAQILNH
jgi:hypothetical protein